MKHGNRCLTVKARVLGGFLLALSLVVAVAVIGARGIDHVVGTFHRHAAECETLVHVVSVDRTVAKLLRNMTLYATTGSAEALNGGR